MTVLPDVSTCYRAVAGRDPRFDGWIYVGVTSTGIYCRPSCPATTPKQMNCKFYAASAAAQQAGFRACRRCRPDAVPGSPQWDVRADVVGKVMRLISDGVVDREGVPGLARRVGYSERQLGRVLRAELGAGPIALARAQRAHCARLLIEGTDLPMSQIALAAGFASVRQFNETVQTVFARPPTALRARGAITGPGSVQLRLPVRQPFNAEAMFRFLATHIVPGVETAAVTDDGWLYARTLQLPHDTGVVELCWDGTAINTRLALADLRDLAPAVRRCRRLLDLDADPVAIDAVLAADPALAPSVGVAPGLRVPGAVDPAELAIRALLGQQISVAAAHAAAGKLAADYGTPIDNPEHPTLSRLFPGCDRLAEVDPATFPMPRARGRALSSLASALASSRLTLDLATDRQQARMDLLALPGIGPWTAGYILMRGLGDPDIFLVEDLVVRRHAAARGLPADPAALADRAAGYAPWRSYATMHLWQKQSSQ